MKYGGYEIETFEINNNNGELMALGWYAKGGWLGTLKEDSIRGLRLRKGNIQIGDEHTLDTIFKQPRFNGWTQGEVFAISDDLIPNARRDNFEQNTAFFILIDKLRNSIGAEISEKIGEASRVRNDPVVSIDENMRDVIINRIAPWATIPKITQAEIDKAVKLAKSLKKLSDISISHTDILDQKTEIADIRRSMTILCYEVTFVKGVWKKIQKLDRSSIIHPDSTWKEL